MATLAIIDSFLPQVSTIIIGYLTLKGTDFEVCEYGGLLEDCIKCEPNEGLSGACRGGHTKLVEILITKGATNFDGGLYEACEGGHMPLVELMITEGATSCMCGKSLKEH